MRRVAHQVQRREVRLAPLVLRLAMVAVEPEVALGSKHDCIAMRFGLYDLSQDAHKSKGRPEGRPLRSGV